MNQEQIDSYQIITITSKNMKTTKKYHSLLFLQEQNATPDLLLNKQNQFRFQKTTYINNKEQQIEQSSLLTKQIFNTLNNKIILDTKNIHLLNKSIEKTKYWKGFIIKQKKFFNIADYKLFDSVTQNLIMSASKNNIFSNKYLLMNTFKQKVGQLKGNFFGNVWYLTKQQSKQKLISIKYKVGFNNVFRKQEVKLYEKQQFGNINLVSKQPKFQKQSGKYILDFQNIAKIPSVRNFILTYQNGNDNLFIFGKSDQNVYTMLVRYPLSPLQGFALGITSLVNKLSIR